MLAAPIPADEAERLSCLRGLGVLDTAEEDRFDRLTRTARRLFGVRQVGLGLVDARRQWFKSRVGLEHRELPRELTFCAHTVLSGLPLVVPDATKDARFAGNPQVREGGVRFYAGAPLVRTAQGSAVGTLCLLDPEPQAFGPDELAALLDLARAAEGELLQVPPRSADSGLWRAPPADSSPLAFGTQRLELLRDLAVMGLTVTSPGAMVDAVLERLADAFPLLRAAWLVIDGGRRARIVACRGPGADLSNLDAAVEAPAALQTRQACRWPSLEALLAPLGVAQVVAVGVEESPHGRSALCFASSVPVEWTDADLSSLREVADQMRLVLHSLEERRQRHEAEQALRLANARLSTLLQEMPLAVWVTSADRRLVLANREAHRVFVAETGRRSEDLDALVGRPTAEVVDVLAGAVRDPAYRELARAQLERPTVVRGAHLHFSSGRTYERDVVPVVLDGQSQGLMTLYRDITQQAEALRHLELARNAALDASRAKSEFLAAMSHEIRTPMNGLLGMLTLLQAAPLPPEQRELTSTAVGLAESLLGLLSDILDASRIEAGQLKLELVPFSPAQLVTELNALFAPRAQARGLNLVLSAGHDVPPLVQGDPLRIRQVLSNLLSNAVKFTAEGSVRLHLSHREGTLLVRVKDTGPGIPAGKKARLFDRFVQGDASTTRRHGGTGLGLSICKQLVDLMDGALSLVDTPTGTSWEVRLPAPLATPTPAPAPAPRDERFEGVCVLVVDDNKVNRHVARALLQGLGCQVEEATNGKEAVEQVLSGRHPYQLVYMDCHMPEMDGFEATQRIRSGLDRPLPIVALTASVLAEDVSHCRSAGMDDFLAKPTRRDDFVRTLRQWVHHRVSAGAP